MQIVLNGQNTIIKQNITIADLLQEYCLDAKKIAVELNCNLVFHHDFINTILKENDVVEIVHFIGGG